MPYGTLLLTIVTLLCLAGAAATLAILVESVRPLLAKPGVVIHQAIGDTKA